MCLVYTTQISLNLQCICCINIWNVCFHFTFTACVNAELGLMWKHSDSNFLMFFPSCTGLEVCFSIDPPNYVVDEGGKVDITLKTNRRFDAPFSIISATSDGSARGMH